MAPTRAQRSTAATDQATAAKPKSANPVEQVGKLIEVRVWSLLHWKLDRFSDCGILFLIFRLYNISYCVLTVGSWAAHRRYVETIPDLQQ